MAVPVQMTNDSSSVSKMSAVARNYWTDPFLRYFIRKTSRRAPLINRGYYIRLKAVEYAVSRFISEVSSSPAWQIVSYGAGFDTTFFRLASEDRLANGVFYEIDLPNVVKRKSEIIMDSPELRILVGHCDKPDRKMNGCTCIITSKYRLVSIDLNDVESLQSQLQDVGIDVLQPTLFLSECVLTYLDQSRSSTVIEWTARTFPKSMFVTYEQVHPTDGFGRVMMSHFETCQSPLKNIISYPTPRDQEERYMSLGFETSRAFNMNYFYFKILDDYERDRVRHLEQFDEFEEWHLKCSHYVLIMSVKGIKAGEQLTRLDSLLPSTNGWKWESLLTAKCITSTHLQRFGHASACSGSGDIVVFGGFGLDGKQHARLSSASLVSNYERECGGAVNCLNLPIHCIGATSDSIPSLIFHSLTALGNEHFLVAGGRGSPLAPSSAFYFLSLKYNEHAGDDASFLNESKPKKDVVLEWTELEMCGDPIVGRWRHSASLISTEDDDKCVFLFGGRTSNFVLDDAVEINVKTRTINMLENVGVVPGARHSHSAAVYNQEIIVSGGLTESETALSDVYVVQILMRGSKKAAVWEKVDLVPAIEPRYCHTSHVCGDFLFLVGGIQMIGGGCGGLTIINMRLHSAISFHLPDCSPGKPILLHKHTSELLWDRDKRTGRILIIGGGGTCFSFGTHINCGIFIVELDREFALAFN